MLHVSLFLSFSRYFFIGSKHLYVKSVNNESLCAAVAFLHSYVIGGDFCVVVLASVCVMSPSCLKMNFCVFRIILGLSCFVIRLRVRFSVSTPSVCTDCIVSRTCDTSRPFAPSSCPCRRDASRFDRPCPFGVSLHCLEK